MSSGRRRQRRYSVRVSDTPPVNPIKATGRWLGYYGLRFEPIVLVVSAIGLAVGGGIWAENVGFALLVIVFSACLPLPGFLWRRRTDADDVTSDARELLLEESLRPLLELGATTTSEPKAKRVTTAEAAAQRVSLDLRNAFSDIDGIRVVVFRVSEDGTQMTPFPPAGRQSRPGPFERGTARGDKAFSVLEGRDPYVMVEDLAKADPNEWQGTGDGYATFVSAPIRSSSEGLGMLTVDAPKAGALDARHGSTLALFAAALGVLFAEAVRGGGGAR